MRTLRRRVAALTTAALVMPLTVVAFGLATATPAAASGCPGRHANDIDDDGHADTVIGSPTRASGGLAGIGSINVIRGGSAGLTATGNQYVDETILGSVDPAASSDEFGIVSAVGFFNSDCYADVAVAVPGDEGNHGGIVVIYGSASGLNLASAQKFSYASFDTTAFSFGLAITAGDFNGDGYDDVAVGAPNGDLVGDVEHQYGAVAILYGSAGGITLTGSQWFTQDTPGVPGTLAQPHVFGAALAAGDFNGDGRADLAIGAEGDKVGTVVQAGSVTVLYGSATGLTATGAQRFTQNSTGVPGTAQFEDNWGWSLAAGDITGDGRADLAVGDTNESVNGKAAAGTVTVFYGSASGLTSTGAQLFDEATTGVPGVPEANDRFGWALAIGDFNGDGHGDLAVGVPNESVGSVTFAGAVIVLYGRSTGLTGTGAQLWDQNTAGVAGVSEQFDDMGESLQALNLTGGTTSALIIGVYGESSNGFTENGGVNVLLGSSSGLTATGNRWWDGTSLAGGAQTGATMSLTHLP